MHHGSTYICKVLTDRECPPSLFVRSFSTLFQVKLDLNCNSKASIVGIDTSTQGEGGGFLCWLNSTADGLASGHSFAL